MLVSPKFRKWTKRILTLLIFWGIKRSSRRRIWRIILPGKLIRLSRRVMAMRMRFSIGALLGLGRGRIKMRLWTGKRMFKNRIVLILLIKMKMLVILLKLKMQKKNRTPKMSKFPIVQIKRMKKIKKIMRKKKKYP